MANYDEFVELANELLTEAGRVVVMQKLAAKGTDSTKPWNTSSINVIDEVTDIPAAFFPASGSDLGLKVITEEMLKRCEQVALVAPIQEGLELMTRMIDSDNSVWKLEWVQVLKPAEQTILYVIGVKR